MGSEHHPGTIINGALGGGIRSLLTWGEGQDEGLWIIEDMRSCLTDRVYPLTPALSPWERERPAVVDALAPLLRRPVNRTRKRRLTQQCNPSAASIANNLGVCS